MLEALQLLIRVVIPIYILIAIGFIIGRLSPEVETRSISKLVLFVFAPALIIHSFKGSNISTVNLLKTLVVAASVVVVGYAFAIPVGRGIFGKRNRAFEISSVFMNSGYLGLPLIYLIFGEGLFPLAVAFCVSVTLLHFTVGILLLNPKGVRESAKEIVKLPLLHSLWIGLLLRGSHFPQSFDKMLKLTGDATIPLMLVALGINLSRIKASMLKTGAVSSLIRFASGGAAAFLAGSLLFQEKSYVMALTLQASLPSAVMNFVLCEAFCGDAQLAASIILISTTLYPAFFLLLSLFAGIR